MRKIFTSLALVLLSIGVSCQSQKKDESISIEALDGFWQITEVAGQATPDSLLSETYILFDLAEERVSGKASCNLFHGSIQKDEEAPDRVALSELATTMMACPHLDFERQVLDALGASARATRQGDQVLLLDAEGKAQILLTSMPMPTEE